MLKHPFSEDLQIALEQFDYLVNKDYLLQLNDAAVSPSADSKDCILLFKVKTFKAATTYSFFAYVFNALASLETTIGFILNRHKEKLNFYIGLRIHSSPPVSREILMEGFANTFPSSELSPLDQTDCEALLLKLFSPNSSACLTSAVVIPDTAANTPLLETFSSLFTKEDYTALFLAAPAKPYEIQECINDCIDLFNTLSQFTQANYSLFKGIANNKSCTLTENHTKTCGDSCTKTNNSSQGCSVAHYTNISPSTTVPLGASNRVINMSMTLNHADGSNQSGGNSTAKGETHSCAHGDSEANLRATNVANNKTLIYTQQNKAVADAISELTKLIARLGGAGTDAFFRFSAFFLAPLMSTTIRAGYTYAGLASDSSLNLEPIFINTWPNCDPAYSALLTELQHFHIPCFSLSPDCHHFKACTTITSTELLNTFYFPFSPSS